MTAVRMNLAGIGIVAPGLADRAALEAALDGKTTDTVIPKPQPGLMSPRERRRAPATVRYALAAAEAACADAGVAPRETEAVFASGMGDMEVTDYMCRTLANTPASLSPTRFHNSVHNAPAGYWSIGAGATGDVTALSAHYDSLAAALVETAGRIRTSRRPIVLLSYDITTPPTMACFWPVQSSFAAAVVFTSDDGEYDVRLAVAPGTASRPSPPLPRALQQLADDNPAARILALLALIRVEAGTGITLHSEQGPALCITRV